MKDGDIVEQGARMKNCSQKNGFYANLYNSQFEHAEEARKTPVKQNEAVFSDKERAAFWWF